MELQEDAYRVNQVLENVEFTDIINFFRTKVPLKDTESRCELALKHFFNLQEESARTDNDFYEIDLKSDFLCVRHLLKTATDEEIKEMLNILGPVSNRKQIAIKMLLHNQSSPHRKKRKKHVNEIDKCEATSSKLLKFADSNCTSQFNINGNENVANGTNHEVPGPTESLKLTIKSLKGSNGNNKFMIAPSPNDNNILQNEDPNEGTNHEVPGPTESLKLTIKSLKDSNGNNKFMIAPSPNDNNILQNEDPNEVDAFISTTTPETVKMEQAKKGSFVRRIIKMDDISTTTPETVKIEQAEKNSVIVPPFVSKMPNITSVDSSTNDVMYTKPPSTSHNFNVEAGPFIPNLEEQPPDTPSRIRIPWYFNICDDVPVPSTSGADEVVEIDETLDLTSPSTTNGLDLSVDSKIVDSKIVDEKLVLKLIEMFPAAEPEYIRTLCEGKAWSAQNFDEIVTVILSDEEHPKRPERQPSPPKEVDPEEQLMWLKGLLPDADPSYLQEKLDQFAGDHEGLCQFVDDALMTKQYPTLKEYLRKQQLSAQQRQYTTEFDVERFVELFPDPSAIFEDPKRKTTILDASDKCYVKWFMRNKFTQLYAKHVNSIVDAEGGKNVMAIVKALNDHVANGLVKKTRYVSHSRPDTQNMPLLQELAYFEHIEEIRNHIENKKKLAAQERANAKELGLLQNCSCCFDDEVMPSDILTCTGGCRFCRDCIKRGTEVAFGEGKLTFPCLMSCGAEFSLQVLQHVLPPKVFSKIAQKKAVAEVKAAGIEELEACPFCDFATIPAPEDKLFRCLNPDCMKESCRLCKEPSHVPLRCEEVEKDEAVKARTYIENKMTEALIRECWKCNAKFIKEEGCNKMTCSCGAIMCYVCRKPVKDYKHFNGQGGDRFDLCPLYTDNFVVNEKNVLQAAEDAKKAVDPTQLKNDPTADIQKHFANKIKEAEKRAKIRQVIQHNIPPIGLPPAGRMNEVNRLRQELRIRDRPPNTTALIEMALTNLRTVIANDMEGRNNPRKRKDQLRQIREELRPERNNRNHAVIAQAAYQPRYYAPPARYHQIHVRPHQTYYPRRPNPPQAPRPAAVPEPPPEFNEVWDLYQQLEAQHGGEPGNDHAREVGEPLLHFAPLEEAEDA